MQYIGGVKSFVGVIMPLSNNVFYDELSKGIEDAIAPHDLIPAISYSQEDESQENILLTSMQEKGFAGVIAVLLNSRAHSFDALSAKNFYAGFISQADFKPNQCSLAVDHVWGGHIGIEYLHSLGHNRIVWVAGPDHHGQLSARLIGITQTAAELGVELKIIESPELDLFSGQWVAQKILALHPLPEAIFAGNDALAIGICDYLSATGIKIPEEISVLGFDNSSICESGLIPLSTVSQNPYQLGFKLGQQFLNDFSPESEHVHERIVYTPKIIERNSVSRR
jgi:LacI family transcriptional regulator